MDCKHQAKFSFKTLFAKKPTYTCKKCGIDLEMTIMTQSISRALNSILIAALFFKVLAGKPAEDVPGMILSFAVLLLYILIYIIAYYFLVTFGKFVEKVPAQTSAPIAPAVVPGSDNGPDTAADQTSAATAESTDVESAAPDTIATAKPALTKEQQDLIALYDSYLTDDEKSKTATTQAPHAAPGSDQATDQDSPHLHETCDHAPKKSWKNYIPSQFNFTCEKCGQPITFSQQTKKHVNLAIMAIIFVILMPSFLDTTVSHLKFIGLTAIAVALSTGIQYFYVRKSKYIDNPQAHTTSQPRRRR